MRKLDKHSIALNKTFLVNLVRRQVMPVPAETVEEAFAKAKAHLNTLDYSMGIEGVFTDDGEMIWNEEQCRAVLEEQAKAKIRARTTDPMPERRKSQARTKAEERMNTTFCVDVVRRQVMLVEAETVEEAFAKGNAFIRTLGLYLQIEGVRTADGETIWGEDTCLAAS